ncbi:MAG: LysM peptidoglycan-binding domain-containing protein [Kiritimatiellae bacterium]|nr:LysM peptidoglycan-binding domain-containing protein [Kiritimatiellia bacterium]
MKAKLGFAIGVNVAVACLLMQGCKAPRVTDNNYGSDVKTVEAQPVSQPVVAPTDDIKVADAPVAAPKAGKAAEAPVVVETAPVAVETAPVTVEPAPVVVAPTTAPVAAPAGADDFTVYTVKPGDMLSKISKRYNIRQKAILDLNPGLAPNKLYAGKKIKLPGKIGEAAPVAPAVAAVPAEAASVTAPKTVKAAKYTGETKEYVVQRGDSLSIIAHRNGTNVRTLKELNGVSTDRVFIGQKLKVPAAAKAAEPAVEKPAEVKVAAKPAVKAEAKKAAEVKAPVAKEAKVPAAKEVKAPVAKETAAKKAEVKEDVKAPAVEAKKAAAAPVAAPAAEAAKPVEAVAAPVAEATAPAAVEAPAPAPVASEIHTVKEGEDVVSIAISYGVSPSALMDANDLKSSEVKPGDKLKIPAKSAQ